MEFKTVILFFFWLHPVAYGILVPQPAFKPLLPALGVRTQALEHQRTAYSYFFLKGNFAVYTEI